MTTTKKGKNIITFADLDQTDEGEERKRVTQTTKQTPVQASQDDWEDSEPTGFSFSHQGTQQQQAPKQPKKKVVKHATWDEQKDDKPKQEAPVEPPPAPKDEFTAVKKPQKIMNLPFKGGQAVPKKVDPGVNIDQVYFPSLGEEMPVLPDPPKPKASERHTEKPVEAGGVSFSRAPPKFTTAKKIERSDPTAKDESPPHASTQPISTQSPPSKDAANNAAAADGKFKFGEKKSFVGKTGSDKKQPLAKTEEELKREQKEREVDERLQKQREEEQKAREERLARKGPKKEEDGVKKEEVVAPVQTPPTFIRKGPKKEEESVKKEEVVAPVQATPTEASKDKKVGFSNLKRREEPMVKEEIKTEAPAQEVQTKLVKKNPKPRNPEENGEKKELRRKPKEEKPAETPKEEPEVKEEPKPTKPQEVIAVTAAVTTASWDTGLKKVPKKKA